MSDNLYTNSNQATLNSQGHGCPVSAFGEQFNPFEDPYISDPYAFLKEARRNEPVFYSPEIDHWIICEFDLAKEILGNDNYYSASNAQSPIKNWPQEAVDMFNAEQFNLVPYLTNNDPPSHTHVRKFLRDAFTPRRIKWIEPKVRQVAIDAINRITENGTKLSGTVDLVEAFLFEAPARVLFTFLGMPEDVLPKIKDWSAGRAVLTWGKLPDEEIIAMMPSFIEYLRYCVDKVDELEVAVRNGEIAEDYTSELIKQYHEEEPEGFDKIHIVLTLFGLFMAGHETTTNQSANSIRALLQYRENWEALCEDPSLVTNAVEETMRYDSGVISWRRIAKQPVTLGGIDIAEGAKFLIMLGSANRDDATFDAGETLDIRRKNARKNLSFGHGIHYCLGAPLARLELKIFLEELTSRLPSLRLVENQTYTYSPNTSHRGPSTLLVEW